MLEEQERQASRMSPTSWQAITKYFPAATFDSKQKSWMTLYLSGMTEQHETLQRTLANIISRIEIRNLESKVSRDAKDSKPAELDDSISAFEALAQEYGFNERLKVNYEEQVPTGMVPPEQVRLIRPDEAKIIFYPRGLKCDKCGYYSVHTDLSTLRALDCPKCKDSKLRQLSVLFYCKKCAHQHEVTPKGKEPDKDGPVFKCQQHKNCNGDLLLQTGKRLTDWAWICSKTKEKVDDVYYLCRFCSDFANGKFVRMKLVPSTQTYLRPMTYASVYFGDRRVPKIDESEVYWSFSRSSYTDEHKKTIHGLGIDDIKIIENVQSVMAVYGYTTYEPNAKVKFFKRRNPDTNQFEYRAYMIKSEGKAMLVMLNKRRVAQTVLESLVEKLERTESTGSMVREAKALLAELQNANEERVNEIYQWIIDLTKRTLASGSDEQMKMHADLFKLLHSIEHGLTYQAALLTGLEESSFGGMVMIDACSILVYECEYVGAGGVDYIAKEYLLDWIRETIAYIRDCRYDCTDGCVKCLYIRDPMCHPFWPKEVDNVYIYPNSLLSRALCLKFLGLPGPGGGSVDDSEE